jgi:hypothetical protein
MSDAERSGSVADDTSAQPGAGDQREGAGAARETDRPGAADQRSTDTFEGLRTDEDDVTGTPPADGRKGTS